MTVETTMASDTASGMAGHVGLVGPIMEAGEMADAAAEAIAADNPNASVMVQDAGSYVRIHTPGRCRLTSDSFSRALGRPVSIPEIQENMVFYAGRISMTSDSMVWLLGDNTGEDEGR